MNKKLIIGLLAALAGLPLMAGAEDPALIFHMDFNTAMMNRATISRILREVAADGYTHILWEIEDKVRLDSCPEIAHRDALSKSEFKEILAEAEGLGLEPIPLLQTFAHAEYVLKGSHHKNLREQADFYDCYCVSNPETRRFLKTVVHEYLELFGSRVRWFHLGGDEAVRFASCDTCKARSPIELYSEHLDAVSEEIREKGIRPGIWCDMVLGNKYWRDFDKFPNRYMIWHWDYRVGEGRWLPGWTDRWTIPLKRGFDVIFSGASQCGGEGPFLPDFRCHRLNLAYAADKVRTKGMKGLCVTSWSVRHSPKRFQFPLVRFAAKRLRSPGPSVDADWAQALAACGVKMSPAELDALSDWHPDLCYYDGRAWRSLYKDATPPPDGALQDILKRRGLPDAAVLTNLIQEVGATVPKADGDWREAGELQLELLKFMGCVSRGETPPPLPIDRARAFYAPEQTPWGATNAAEIVYGLGRKCGK